MASGRRPISSAAEPFGAGGRSRLAVIGCGAAGALLAIELMRRPDLPGPVELLIVEPRPELGRGVAYSTPDPLHLLNVPVQAMSAVSGDSEHLLRWAREQGSAADGSDFLRRTEYGHYLTETLESSLAAPPEEILPRVLRERVRSVSFEAGRPLLELESGERTLVDHAVLALGGGPVQEPFELSDEVRFSGRYHCDPWEGDPRRLARDGETILLVGTGLTMVDIALSIEATTRGTRMIAISRSGLLAKGHRPGQPLSTGEPFRIPPDEPLFPALLSSFFVALSEKRMTGGDATDVIDSMRPITQQLWQTLKREERVWFLRHMRRLWDVHRHRMAPRVAGRIAAMRADGTLEVTQAALSSLALAGEEILAHTGERPLRVDRVVNCAGPEDDVARIDQDPVRQMIAAGVCRRDDLGLGLAATPAGAVIDRSGRPAERLHAIGSLRKGSLWETTAIPEIRRQAFELAELLVAAVAARRAPSPSGAREEVSQL
jgi:uncharacterized NAD(P)/FAD-binding protein YdhS